MATLGSVLANKKVIKAQQSGTVKEEHWTAMLATPATTVGDNKQMVGVVFYQK